MVTNKVDKKNSLVWRFHQTKEKNVTQHFTIEVNGNVANVKAQVTKLANGLYHVQVTTAANRITNTTLHLISE